MNLSSLQTHSSTLWLKAGWIPSHRTIVSSIPAIFILVQCLAHLRALCREALHHLTLRVAEAPGANAHNTSRLSRKAGVFVWRCFGFASRIVFALSCLCCWVRLCCSMFYSLVWCKPRRTCLPWKPYLTYFMKSRHTLIRINSFDVFLHLTLTYFVFFSLGEVTWKLSWSHEFNKKLLWNLIAFIHSTIL